MYSFEEQLKLGKLGESIVYNHIRTKPSVVCVKDLSEIRERQEIGVDAIIFYDREWIIHATLVDVKTDFKINQSKKFFLETKFSKSKWCFLTTKAEYFLYYDVMGKLYYLSILELRNWYNSEWKSRYHYQVKNNGYTSEWILVTVDEMLNITTDIAMEDIDKLENV